MYIHVRRIIHQFAKGTERADDGCRDDFLQQVLQSQTGEGVGVDDCYFRSHSRFFCFCKNTDYFLGFVCAGLQNEKFSYAELFSLSFWGAGSVSFRILAGADIEIFLKDFPEVFPIAETGSFCYFSHGIFPFFQ
ncbi:Uncharacterised protein [Bacteroides uniformis]|uniref:Uncharacterized protein n=1 Tax=Bacteroides uniformis TaxID=820 RepID=A0A173YDH9_BACUN|nr:Uncharacterised protein [Bacteroides uniformis]